MSLIKGVQVQFGTAQLTLPPFSLRIMFDNEELIKRLQKPDDMTMLEYVKDAMPLLLATLQRNYPEMTEAEFLERADPSMVMEMLELSFAQSGFVPLTPGAPEAADPDTAPQD